MEKLKFVAFKGGKIRGSDEPKIRITKQGGIKFNAAFLNKYSNTNTKFAALRYAEDEIFHYLGISFTNDQDIKGVRKVSVSKSSGVIYSISYFKTYKINLEKAVAQYDVEEMQDDEFGKLYVVKIPKTE